MIKTLPLGEILPDIPEPHRNLFSSPEWLTVIDQTYRPNLFMKCIERDWKAGSYIIYAVVRNFLEWKICVCSYCDYFDCGVTSFDDWEEFFAELRREYPEYRIAVRNLRDENVRRVKGLKELSRERFHILDIRENLDAVWRRAHDSFKAAVNQAADRKGVTVRTGGRAELDKFYRMHLEVRRRKYKIFPQPFRLFENIWREYMEKDKGVLLAAYSPGGKMIAANIYLFCGDTAYYKFNTSSQDALQYRPNNLLFWEGVKAAKARGLEFIDLGSSGYDQEGLIRYKNHTGARMIDIHHLGYTPPDYKPSQKRILRMWTWLFTRPWVPVPMVRFGSQVIYPYLA